LGIARYGSLLKSRSTFEVVLRRNRPLEEVWTGALYLMMHATFDTRGKARARSWSERKRDLPAQAASPGNRSSLGTFQIQSQAHHPNPSNRPIIHHRHEAPTSFEHLGSIREAVALVDSSATPQRLSNEPEMPGQTITLDFRPPVLQHGCQ